MSRYATKMINSKFYGLTNVSSPKNEDALTRHVLFEKYIPIKYIGHKGEEFLGPGYILVPYILVQLEPLIIEDFSQYFNTKQKESIIKKIIKWTQKIKNYWIN
jgi:hypothetical protein